MTLTGCQISCVLESPEFTQPLADHGPGSLQAGLVVRRAQGRGLEQGRVEMEPRLASPVALAADASARLTSDRRGDETHDDRRDDFCWPARPPLPGW